MTDSSTLERGLVGVRAMGMILVVESDAAESKVETVGGGAFCVRGRKPYRLEARPWKYWLTVVPWDITNCCVVNNIIHTKCRIV